jgi:hypothetical protein
MTKPRKSWESDVPENGVLTNFDLELAAKHGILSLVAGARDIPQGLKPSVFCPSERPKAKALGYLDAKTNSSDRTLVW